jgi:exodeoxyribonuclease V alpha subunit
LPLIIIDEASMVDLGSLYRIMSMAPEGCRFLLVGDDGQLPPVGFGLTFHALIDVEEIPRTVLTDVMRQDAETGIPAFAQAIRNGVLPDLPIYNPIDEVGVAIAACDRSDVVTVAVSIRRSLPAAQIVGSIRGGGDPADGGTDAMNAGLHDSWSAARKLDPTTWLRGEPVIWTINDYDLDLWNGSLGKVLGLTTDGLAVRFDEGDRTIPIELLDHLERAWAITTHKAQGSQFETVIVPVTPSRILDRALIYTAVTRGKRRVVLVGDPADFRSALARPAQATTRKTWLQQAVRDAISSHLTAAA